MVLLGGAARSLPKLQLPSQPGILISRTMVGVTVSSGGRCYELCLKNSGLRRLVSGCIRGGLSLDGKTRSHRGGFVSKAAAVPWKRAVLWRAGTAAEFSSPTTIGRASSQFTNPATTSSSTITKTSNSTTRNSSLAVRVAVASAGLAALSAVAFGAFPNGTTEHDEPTTREQANETIPTASIISDNPVRTRVVDDSPGAPPHRSSFYDNDDDNSSIHRPSNYNTQNRIEPRRSIHPEHGSLGFPFYDYLLKQLNVVVYVEDRDAKSITSDSGRNKPSGLVGLACLHCLEQNSNSNSNSNNLPNNLDVDASIFPQDRRSLAKDVSIKMYHHVSNCDRCPTSTKEKIRKLHQEHETNKQQQQQRRQLARPVKGKGPISVATPRTSHISREERLYFKDLWYRMGHKEMAAEGPRGGKRRPFDTMES